MLKIEQIISQMNFKNVIDLKKQNLIVEILKENMQLIKKCDNL